MMKQTALLLFAAIVAVSGDNLRPLDLPSPKASQAEWQQWREETQRLSKEKERSLVKELHEKIVSTSGEIAEKAMQPYTNSVTITNLLTHRWDTKQAIPVSSIYVMIPIKGGEFIMGSPPMEPGRRADEGPQHKVKVSAFWMEKCEVTWDQFEPFMLGVEEIDPNAPVIREPADAVAKPTKPYGEMTFGMGTSGDYPAIAMTQHAANKYCEWLSAKTGHFYRLPTEAEWEYACRAGTTNTYSFGDEELKLRQYAWYADDTDKYGRVGKKKPNPWGLYDMHGNVAEWCLDQYDPSFYLQAKDKLSVDPWNKATKPYPHVLRGGSWDLTLGDPSQLRSAARGKSQPEWKTDPQLPPTFWYLDQAPFVGFRIVRPLKVPTADEMFRYWNSGVERDEIKK